MRRYIFLQTYAWTLMVMGVCVWVLTGVAVVLAIANGPAVIPLNNVLGVNVSNIFSGVLYLEVGTVALVGFLSGLSLLASGELLMLLMDIAQDSRFMRIAREREIQARTAAGQPPGQWYP